MKSLEYCYAWCPPGGSTPTVYTSGAAAELPPYRGWRLLYKIKIKLK